MAISDELQAEVTASIGAINSAREIIEAAVEEIPQICLPRTGGEMLGPVGNLKLAGELNPLLYDASAVSAKWAVDKLTNNLASQTNVFVKPSTGSDTQNLNSGRGLFEDLPFASVEAAYAWIMASHASNGVVYISLLEDVVCEENLNIFMGAVATLGIISYPLDGELRKITFKQGLQIYSGHVGLNTLKVDIPREGYGNAFHVTGNMRGTSPMLTLKKCELSGSVEQVFALDYNATIFWGSDCASTIDGKKYSCVKGSRLLTAAGESSLPGTTAGTKDASSYVI